MNQQHLQNNQNAAKNYMNNPGNPQAQPHMMPDNINAGDAINQSDLLLQLQQIHQYVAQSQPEILAGGQKPTSGPGGASGAVGNPELGPNAQNGNNSGATPQNILAALADFQKQQPAGGAGFGGQDNGGGDGGFGNGGGGKSGGGDENNAGGQAPQSSAHGQQQQQLGGVPQLTQQQIVDQKSVANLDLNSQASAGGLNPAFYNNLLQMGGLQGFNGTSGGSMGQMPSNIAGQTGNQSFDLMQLGQLGQLGNMGNYNLPNMMNFQIPPLQHSFSGGMSGGHMGGQSGNGGGGHGSAASFHQPTEKNQVKLFVGGLAFSTSEQHLQTYFEKFGKVENTIVMREKLTQRGRGFGFVLLSFNDEDQAQQIKRSIIGQNKTEGHWILEKRVDVKSADDHQGRGEGGNMGGGGGGGHSHHGGHGGGGHHQNNNFMMTNNGQHIQKPNPYVQVVQKDGVNGSDDPKDSVKFTYPKSKIFVGGLDFKLTSEELKEHFMKFGEVHDAIILKDIYTGSSRGFGFVTFTNESVAQDLIKNNPVTEINGRRVDIKKAEPKDKSSNQGGGGGGGGNGGGGGGGGRPPFPPRGGGGNFHGGNNGPMGHNQMGGNQPAVIPPYGQQVGGGRDGPGGGRGGHGHRGGMGGHHHPRYGNRGSSEDKQFGNNADGDNGGNYHGGGGRDFHRQASGGYRQFDNERGESRGYGGRGGYNNRNNDGGHHGGNRGPYEKRGSFNNNNNHHRNQHNNQNTQNNQGAGANTNNPRAGSSSSHESGQDSSYHNAFERANNALRKRHEQDAQNNNGGGQQQQGRPGQGHHRNNNRDGGNNYQGGRGQNNQNHGGFQQPSNSNQMPGGNNGGNNDGGAQGDYSGGKLNKQGSQGPNDQRRRYRSRSRD